MEATVGKSDKELANLRSGFVYLETAEKGTEMDIHCDDLIDDESQPSCLRDFLRYNRAPAVKKTLSDNEAPKLFATIREDIMGRSYLGYWDGNNPAMKDVPMKAGQTVRVVMASRFGDVGITPNLKASHGYVARVMVSKLENFSSTSA